MRGRSFWVSLWIGIYLLSMSGTAVACTLWSAAGDRVAGGGTMIHKNRDWNPDHQQELRLVTPQNGYRYLSLYTVGNAWVGTKAGVNSEGLVIVTASAPSHLDKRINFMGRTNTATLLSRYDSVDAALMALEADEWKSGPQFILMADKNETASIEFGPKGEFVLLSRESNGVLFHTNHYLSDTLAALNPEKISFSSLTRYKRIAELIGSRYALEMEDDKDFSKDPILWRPGTTPTSVRTLSTWTIRHFKDGRSTLYLTMANPGRLEMAYEITIADVFAGKYDVTEVR